MDYTIDQATLDLIVELQMQDAQSLIKGKHTPGGQVPDQELAVEMFKLELESLASCYSDHVMSRSIAHAVLTDGNVIKDLVEEEQQAARDREYAMNGECPVGIPAADTAESVAEDDMINKLAVLYVDSDTASVVAESSSSGRNKRRTKMSDKRRCVACMAEFPFFATVQCPCSDDYCRGCIADLFTAAISDESLFPPRCCGQTIPLGLNQIFLPAKLVGEYRAKELEYTTPNRTYCHRPTCSTFVPPSFIYDDVATCVKCHSRTCVICKASSHNNECPKDAVTLDFLRFANEQGWQRCNSCRRLVELSTGCNHITCRCGAQFCYVCGVRWKECACAQWDENRLLNRANVIVERDAFEVEEEERAALVERERRNLVENHQCSHNSWKSRRGPHWCEECLHYLPEYIYECRRCRILACRKCRYNRL